MALQIRRGLEADRSSITPIEGELLYVTDTGSVYIGDGSTAGGNLVKGDVVSDTSPQLGGNLDLNGNNITGTGNINIDGTITATGNINLGDETSDNVGILGSLTTTLTPLVDSAVDIGSSVKRWRSGYFAGLSVDGQIDASTVNANILADNSTIAYNSSTGQFDGTFVGDIKGSVFGDDSTAIVDAVSNTLRGNLFGDADGNHTGTFNGEITATGTLDGDADGNHTGTFNGEITATGTLDGDVTGSIFADDSTLLVDSVNGLLSGILQTNRINFPLDSENGFVRIRMISTTSDSEAELNIQSLNDRASIRLTEVATSDLSADNGLRGLIRFEKSDTVDIKTIGFFGMGNNYFKISVDENGLFPNAKVVHFEDGNFGIGTQTPTENLHVVGNALFTGDVTAAAFKGSVVADDSSILVDAISGTIPGYVKISELKTALQDGAGDYAAFKAWVLANL